MAKILELPVQLSLNLEQAKSLYWEESIILGSSGGIPVSRVEKLFGKGSTEFLFCGDLTKVYGRYANIYCTGNCEFQFLYLDGFLKVVTNANLRWLAEQESMGAYTGGEYEETTELRLRGRKRRAAR